MKNNEERTLQQSILRVFVTTLALLIVPLIASQLISGFDWGIEDYIFAGLIFFTSGFIYERGIRSITNSTHRSIATVVLIVVVTLIWIEAAVGMFN